MDVLVLGGTGNISGAVVRELMDQGHAVTLLNRGLQAAPAGVDHIVCDRYDADALAASLQQRRFDAAVDFLCFTPDHARDAHAALSGRCDRYVFISSATVYRKPHDLPVREDHPLGNAESEYARLKQACEEWLLANQGELPVTVVRPSHTFSQRWIPSPLHGTDFTVARRILDGKPIVVHDRGQSLWALTASEDFALGLIGLLDLASAAGECFHITTDEVLTWNAIYHEIGRALGRQPILVPIPTETLCALDPAAEGKLRGDKAHHGVFDNRKIRAAVPTFACRSQRAALTRSVEWFLADPARQLVDEQVDANIDRTIAAWKAGSSAG